MPARFVSRACRLAIGVLVLASAGCGPSLPEMGSPSATLYVQRCGTCHPPYNPALLTSKMWEAMVQRMEGEMRRRGMELSPADKALVLDYLARNAGKT
jgi:hypothetical protein